MRDYVNEHLADAKDGTPRTRVVPCMVCADGTTLSVQASRSHYCSPQSDTGPWTAVEVWCVQSATGRNIAARSFGSNHDDPYGWVPVETVNKFIRRHGGVKES